MTELVQAVVSGLGVGAVYALIAFGISLVYAVSRTLNFAHGEVLNVGVFLALTAVFVDLPPWQGILVGIAGATIVGLGLERAVFRPLHRSADGLGWLLGVLIFAGVVTNVTARIWGHRAYNAEITGVGDALGADVIYQWGSARVPAIYLWLFVAGALIMVGVDALVRRTAFGRAVRAVAHSRRTAALVGVDVERTMVWAFALASALGALAGILAAPVTFVSVQLGGVFTFKGLVAAVIGGLGSARGAFAGGLILGVVEAVARLWMEPGYADAVALGVLILMLLARPVGLLGRVAVERH